MKPVTIVFFIDVPLRDTLENRGAGVLGLLYDFEAARVARAERRALDEGDHRGRGDGRRKAAGLVDVKVVRFSDTHTAEKFVIPLASRKSRRGQ